MSAQGLNEADAAAGMPGDIICYDRDGNIVLAVEVKEHELAMADLRASISKARRAEGRLSNLLFVLPGARQSDRQAIEDGIHGAWAAGLNVHRVDIVTLAVTAFALLDEEWRIRFLREIGEELDRRGDLGHREAWRDLLSEQ